MRRGGLACKLPPPRLLRGHSCSRRRREATASAQGRAPPCAASQGRSQTCFTCSIIGYMPSLAHQLFGRTRSAVLSVLLLRPEASLHVRELARLTGASAGSLHRELRLLSEMGLLLRRDVGRQVHYQANTTHPVHAELSQLLRKTAGLVDVLREALEPLGAKVQAAFVYGSVAAGTERPASDVDVMVIGTATFADLARALARAQAILRREVNPTVMTRREFASKLTGGDTFLRSVMKGDKLWLKGDQMDLAESPEDRTSKGSRSQRNGSTKAAPSFCETYSHTPSMTRAIGRSGASRAR